MRVSRVTLLIELRVVFAIYGPHRAVRADDAVFERRQGVTESKGSRNRLRYHGSVVRVDKAEGVLKRWLDGVPINAEDRASAGGPFGDVGDDVHLDAADAGDLLHAIELRMLPGQGGLIGGAMADLADQKTDKADQDYRRRAADRTHRPGILVYRAEDIAQIQTDRSDRG